MEAMRAMDPKNGNIVNTESKTSPNSRCSAAELKPQHSSKHGLNFEQFCKERVSAMQASTASLVTPASSSYSSLVSKPIPGTKHTIDAILGLRSSQSLKSKLYLKDTNLEANCSERSESESIGSNSKSGNESICLHLSVRVKYFPKWRLAFDLILLIK